MTKVASPTDDNAAPNQTWRTEEYSLDFTHHAALVASRPGETLLDTAQRHDIEIASVCGGWGICKSCIVQFKAGTAPIPSPSDRNLFSSRKLEQGWRRACQSKPVSDAQIRVPARTRIQSVRTFAEGGDIWVAPEPSVTAHDISLTSASLKDGESDADRLCSELRRRGLADAPFVDLEVMRRLPRVLRTSDWSARIALRGNEVVAVLPPKSRLVGAAVDLGTTNIALLLVELTSGDTVAQTGIENPQKKFGGDVISRMTVARRTPGTVDKMRADCVAAIGTAIAGLCVEVGCNTEQVVDLSIAGNTAMNHILTGLPTEHLGVSPFVGTARAMPDLKARDLGLQFGNGAWVQQTDNIAGFVGGDHTAVLVGIGALTETRTVAVVDIGTNTEISLIHQGRITSLSAPSGPALEGGNITHGMRAADGAIERVKVDGDKLGIATIANASAIGICGSGVLDALAAFAAAGDINHRGQINAASPRFHLDGDEAALLLSEGRPGHPILFTQTDTRNVQLAKGAIRGGIEVLLQLAGLEAADLDRIVIAGAFGLFVHIESAVAIGMLPDIERHRFSQVGNAACMGAKLALISQSYRASGEQIAQVARYIEQSGSAEFMKCFMAHINLPNP